MKRKKYWNQKLDLEPYFPPGLDWKKAVRNWYCGLSGAFFVGMFWYLCLYGMAKAELYVQRGGDRLLRPGAVMDDFYTLMHLTLVGFIVLGFYTAVQGAAHYSYHHQGSKSIYLMKRLPDKMELHRRCLTLPVAGLLLCALTAFLTVALCYGIYVHFTPEECLRPHQWEMFWRF